LRHVVGIRDRYLKNNPNSESEPEINWHTAALLLRVAFAVAAAGQNGAVRLARGAARYDARLVLSAVPRLVGKLLRHFASPNAFPRH
jgi:hypothetical protein